MTREQLNICVLAKLFKLLTRQGTSPVVCSCSSLHYDDPDQDNQMKDVIMPGGNRTLGAVIADLRARNGWTLKDMSQHSGIPVSTLSKIEHGRLSLTYDKLQKLAERLKIRMADLFADEEEKASAPRLIVGRRSIGTMQSAVRVDTPNYEYNYVCTELRNKRMVPVITRVHVQSIDDFGELVRHPGEEFIYVIQGSLVVHTEYYDPVQLEAGQSLYIDSDMGHAYVCASNCDEVLLLGVMSSGESQ